MKQQEFLDKLKAEIEKLGQTNSQEILADYQEHFAHGLRNGKTEEEIADKLGNPASIAKAYEAELLLNRVSQPQSSQSPSTPSQFAAILTVLGRLLIIAPLNFFIFLIPGVIIFSLLVAGWSVAIALIGVCFAAFGVGIKIGLFALGLWGAIAFLSGGASLFFFGLFAGLVLYIITKFVIEGLIEYLKWNLKFVLEK